MSALKIFPEERSASGGYQKLGQRTEMVNGVVEGLGGKYSLPRYRVGIQGSNTK